MKAANPQTRPTIKLTTGQTTSPSARTRKLVAKQKPAKTRNGVRPYRQTNHTKTHQTANPGAYNRDERHFCRDKFECDSESDDQCHLEADGNQAKGQLSHPHAFTPGRQDIKKRLRSRFFLSRQ